MRWQRQDVDVVAAWQLLLDQAKAETENGHQQSQISAFSVAQAMEQLLGTVA